MLKKALYSFFVLFLFIKPESSKRQLVKLCNYRDSIMVIDTLLKAIKDQRDEQPHQTLLEFVYVYINPIKAGSITTCHRPVSQYFTRLCL